METYLLDTSAILHIIAGDKEGTKAASLITGSTLTTSIICYCEVLNKLDLQRQAIAEQYLSKLILLPVTISDGSLARRMQDDCRSRGGQVPTLDCLVAASAANSNATVLTTDSDFERIQQVKKIVVTG